MLSAGFSSKMKIYIYWRKIMVGCLCLPRGMAGASGYGYLQPGILLSPKGGLSYMDSYLLSNINLSTYDLPQCTTDKRKRLSTHIFHSLTISNFKNYSP